MKKISKKEQSRRDASDAKARRSDKLGHSGFIFALQGKLWNRGLKGMPYPTGFITSNGHWIMSAWGWQGQTLCGHTAIFENDPIMHGQSAKREMAHCCRMRLLRIQRRLGYRTLERHTATWCWYVPTSKLAA